MNMIDMYISEIERRLPSKNREDLTKEIRSLVEDAVEDASQGREVDENLIVDVLQKFGSPEQVAASYQPPQYLIGPNLYPTFLMVLKIVLVVISIISAIGIGVSLGRTPADGSDVLSTIGRGGLELVNSLIGAFGYIVLVFAFIHWLTPEIKLSDKTWDPRTLKSEPDPDRINPAGQAVEILFTVAVLLLLNFYSQWVGISNYFDGKWVHAPMLTPIFSTYLPWINLSLIASVVLNILLIRKGSWSPFLRWFSIGLNVVSIILLAVILSGPSIINLNAAELVSRGWPQNWASNMVRALPALTFVFRMALGINLITQVIDLVKKVYKQVSKKINLVSPFTNQ